jgi:hypothetical protein
MSALLLLAAAFLAEPKKVQVTTVDGRTAAGELVELSGQQVVVQSQDSIKSFRAADVRFIGPAEENGAPRSASRAPSDPAKRPAVWVETIDGSRIPGSGYSVTKASAELKLAGGETLNLPTKSIRLVEFPAATDTAPAAWVGELKSDLTADLIVVRKRDGIDYVEGAAGDVNDETFNFSVDSENVPVKRAKVAGIVYFHGPDSPSLPEASCVYEAAAGWRLKAKSITFANGEFKIVTTFGATLAGPPDALKLVDFSAGRMIYLSDLAPLSSEWTPLVDFGKQADSLAKYYRPQQDRGLDNSSLRIGGKTFPKGLAIPSRTSLTYKITGKGKRLKAVAGIDDGVREAGGVHLVISGDGKTLYDRKIVGRQDPIDLDLDVSAVKRLNILVDFGEGLDVGNYLDLCDARIVK